MFKHADWPTPLLTDVVPVKHPWMIDGDETSIKWTGQDDSRWEAYWAADHADGVWHVYCESGEYGEDEEDYMVVYAPDLLDAIANGMGACRRNARPIITAEG